MKAEKAVVLLSGGLDSATCLWWAKGRGWQLYTLTFNYYRRSQKEIEAAEEIARASAVAEHRVIELPFLREVEDASISKDAPLAKELPSALPNYIPARNAIFYAIAASWAEELGARWIAGGHNSTDFTSFPDSTPEFFNLMNRALRIGLRTGARQPIKIILPLSKLNKEGIVSMAMRMGVPAELTWSCHGRGEKHCGKCNGCMARMEAFKVAGFKDPVEYEPSAYTAKGLSEAKGVKYALIE